MITYAIGHRAEQLFQVRLRAFRLAMGATQQQLADAAGLSTNTVSMIERGESSPTLQTMAKLADAFGIEVRELVTINRGPEGPTIPANMEGRMSALCESFPSLRGVHGVRRWSPLHLEAYTLTCEYPQALEAARFCLSVWCHRGLDWNCDGPHQSFDVVDAVRHWDDAHRQALVSWISEPWLP